jgi:hypothetical protein
MGVAAGVPSGIAGLLYLAATGAGQQPITK